jgi:hypothetical protein
MISDAERNEGAAFGYSMNLLKDIVGWREAKRRVNEGWLNEIDYMAVRAYWCTRFSGNADYGPRVEDRLCVDKKIHVERLTRLADDHGEGAGRYGTMLGMVNYCTGSCSAENRTIDLRLHVSTLRGRSHTDMHLDKGMRRLIAGSQVIRGQAFETHDGVVTYCTGSHHVAVARKGHPASHRAIFMFRCAPCNGMCHARTIPLLEEEVASLREMVHMRWSNGWRS